MASYHVQLRELCMHVIIAIFFSNMEASVYTYLLQLSKHAERLFGFDYSVVRHSACLPDAL